MGRFAARGRPWLRTLGVLAMMGASAEAKAAEPAPTRVWLLGGGFPLGGGSDRVGPLYASVAAEADVWMTPQIALGAQVAFTAAGAPDARGADGSYILGLLSARLPAAPHVDLVATLGAGSAHAEGYDDAPRRRFTDTGVLLYARGASVWTWRPFAFGVGLESGWQRSAGLWISPSILLGFAF